MTTYLTDDEAHRRHEEGDHFFCVSTDPWFDDCHGVGSPCSRCGGSGIDPEGQP